jgi:radical SAM superfamily enzyme YgiQ (UPF0313 family)
MAKRPLNLLIAAPFKKRYDPIFLTFTNGMAYINAALRNHGCRVECFCEFGEPDAVLARLKSRVTESKTDVLLCGGLTTQYRVIKSMFCAAREANPGIITVGGGGGFSSEPILFSEMCGVDYAIIGEGEISVCELADALSAGADVSGIRGLVYKTDENQYRFTGHRAPICDLDALPFPSYEGVDIDVEISSASPISGPNTFYTDKPRIMSITYSRSCLFKCAFCFHPVGDRYRTRSMDSFFAELDMYVQKYNINGLAVMDECFCMDDSIFEFCRRIKPYNLKWSTALVLQTITREKLAALRASGCFIVTYGVESLSETVLRDMRKPADVETIERVLGWTAEAGIGIHGNLIFGAEAETAETVRESMGRWFRFRDYALTLNMVVPYPGSAYYAHCVERGIIRDKREYIELGCPNVNMSQLTDPAYDRLLTLTTLPPNDKIAWDFARHGEIIETIPDYDGDPGLISLKLKCFHCGAAHMYGNIPEAEARGVFYMYCRSCGKLSTYGPCPNFNYPLLCQWMKNEANGIKLSDWMAENGFRRVVVYGLGSLGAVVYAYLKNIGAAAGVADQNSQTISFAYTFMNSTPFYTLSSIHEAEADLILVVPTQAQYKIVALLRENGCKGRIETLFDIVYGITEYRNQ